MPTQGTLREFLPLEADLKFDCEKFETPHLAIKVFCRRATLQPALENCRIIRNSRFGDMINDPYETAELTESARELLEQESEISAGGQFEIQRGLLGRPFLNFRKRRFRKKTSKSENFVKISSRIHRVVARTQDRWTVCEPRPPTWSGASTLEVFSARTESKKALHYTCRTFQRVVARPSCSCPARRWISNFSRPQEPERNYHGIQR